jgi:hypothetical protein
VQVLSLAFGVPTHAPLLLHVSGLVHSFRSLQDVLGVQVPAHAPLTHACPVHCLQVPLAPPPQMVAVWLATGTQVLPLQQPLGHEVASHTQAPAEQRCPGEHT